MKNKIKVLVCPLDWGLGHASRDIPVIRGFLENDCEVFIAGHGYSLKLLQSEFPGLSIIPIPSSELRYSGSTFFIFGILRAIPLLIKNAVREHRKLKSIITDYNIDLVVSDNRFGLYNENVYTVYITHQLWIRLPKVLFFMEGLLSRSHAWIIRKYNECWIPDNENIEDSLAGRLSHPGKISSDYYYVGPVSRFYEIAMHSGGDHSCDYELLVILSGPEPQRSNLEKLLISIIRERKLKTYFIRGLPGNVEELNDDDFIKFKNHVSSGEMYSAIQKSDRIICRSGYTSVMDLSALNKKVIYVPTPGQTEQEYLAKYLSEKGMAYFCIQRKEKIVEALQYSNPSNKQDTSNSNRKLERKIDELVAKLERTGN